MRELADRLRKEGIDCTIDQYLNGAPPKGWQHWMENQIEQSDFILIICTELYLQRYRREDTEGGRGVAFEELIISQLLYDEYYHNTKFIPLLPEGGNIKHVPLSLKGYSTYTLQGEYTSLYRVLTEQPATPKPELGEVVDLSKSQANADITEHHTNNFQKIKHVFSLLKEGLTSQPVLNKPVLGDILLLPSDQFEPEATLQSSAQRLQQIQSVITGFLKANPVLGQRLAEGFGFQSDSSLVEDVLSNAINTAILSTCFERIYSLIVTLEQDRSSIDVLLDLCNQLLPILMSQEETETIKHYLNNGNSVIEHPSTTNEGIEGSIAAHDGRAAAFKWVSSQYGPELRGINHVSLQDSAGGEIATNAADNQYKEAFYQKMAGASALKMADKLLKQGESSQALLVKQQAVAERLRIYGKNKNTHYVVLEGELPPVLQEIKQACPYPLPVFAQKKSG